MKLSDIAYYVEDNISSDDIKLFQYVTTDSLLQNKSGRTFATNLPPQACNLTHYLPGDILVANIRPYLKKIWKADIEGGCSKDVFVLRAREGHNADYLYSVALQDIFFDNAMLGNKGTQMPRGDKDKIMELPVLDQAGKEAYIGNLIVDIQKQITLNTRMNAELEAMAKQLYDYWFVQFDFPDKNGKPYKSSGGKMVWNEKLKREIPEGWEVKTLDDLLFFSNGINYEKNIKGDKNYRIINVRNITSSSIFINKEDLDVINLPSKQADKYLISKDDIIIARSGTPGSTRLIMNPRDVIYCGFVIKGTPRKKENKYILMYYLKQLEGTQATKTGGSILQNVSQDTLKALLMTVPPNNLIAYFNCCVEKFFRKLKINTKSTDCLTHLRDSLLPMLMNEQITIE